MAFDLASAAPVDHTDASYDQLDADTEKRLGLPAGSLSSIRRNGEKTDAGRVSSAGARTVYQIIPATRNAAFKQWGLDAWATPKQASEVAGRLLLDSLQRNGGDLGEAVREYHGGTDRSNWGRKTASYGERVLAGVGRAVSSMIPSAQAQEAPGQAGPQQSPAGASFDLGSATPSGGGQSAPAFDLASARPVGEASAAPAPNKPAATSQPSGMDVAAARAASFGRGITDPITGGAQLLTHMLPQSVVDTGNRLNNWLARFGLTGEIPKGGLDEKIQRDEQELAARRKDAGLRGTDWMRAAGNVASPVNYALPAAAPRGLGLAGRAAVTGAQGAAAGALSPVTEQGAEPGAFWREKAKQTAVGAVTGAATTGLASGAARVISPNVRPEVRQMLDAGVRLTPGQLLGGAARSIEEKASSLPLFGEIVHAAERRGFEDFNRAAINKALAPVGEKLPAGMQMGHEAIEYAADKIGAKYDALLPKLNGRVDRQFLQEVAGVRLLGQSMPADRAAQLDRILDKEIIGRFGARGGATGQTLKAIESKLGGMASGMRRSADYDQRSMGDALATVQKSLRDMLQRANPKHARELRSINSAYSQFLRPQTAAARTGTEEGIFSPAQLRSAVRELDGSMRKSAFAKGSAPGQEFAEAAKAVLPRKVPDSGTAGRLAVANLPSAGAGLAAALGAGAFYTPMGQRAAQAAFTSRPPGANALAQLVRENDRLVGAGTIPLSMLPMFSRGE